MALIAFDSIFSSSSPFHSAVEELIAFVGDEFLMLAFAAFVYLACTGNLPNRSSQKNPKVAKRSEHVGDAFNGQAVARNIREGNASKAIDLFLPQLKNDSFVVPTQLGSKLLGLLAKPQKWASASTQASKLRGRFDSCSLERAINDANRQGDAGACKQLCQLASSLDIPRTATVYEVLLKSSALDADELVERIHEMEAHNVGFSKSLVEAILASCAATCRADLAQGLLAKHNIQLDKDVCSALIKVHTRCEQWDSALDLYERIMVAESMKPDTLLAELLTKAAQQCGRTDLLPTLTEFLSGDLGRQAKAIRMQGREGHLQSAIKLFHSIKQPNSLVYNSVLEACVQSNDLASTVRYFGEAKDKSLADVVSYNILIKGYLANNKSTEAQRLLAEMREAGLHAGLITYHSLLNSRVQVGDVREAWRLIEELQAAGLAPNAVTCSILLKVYTRPSHAHDLNRAIALIEGMEAPMDEVLFASVAEACIRTGRLDLLSQRTRKYAETDTLKGLTAPTYGSMIKAYGQAHDVEQVRMLWGEMCKRQVRPTSITLGCMVEALVVNACADEAWDLVRNIANDPMDKPLLNTVIYSTILKGFAMSKRSDKLMALYEEMLACGIACNTITYNTMLNAFAKCGDMHRVPKLLDDMKTADPPVEPDIVTYSTMVKGFCAAGDVDRGMQLLHDMKNDGKLAPDEVMFNSLLDGCARQHRLDDALKLLEDMKQAGVAPSNYTLSIMVKLLGRGRKLTQAFAMVKSVCEEHGFRANVQVYTCLIQACFHNRQTGKAMALHDQVVQEGCCFDQKAYVVLARGCLQAGALDRAVDVVRCAHHIPGHSLQQCPGKAAGVDSRCLEEVLAKLGPGSEAARRLRAEVERSGVPKDCYARKK